MRYEMRFSGSGGQGVILASVIVAEAAVAAGLNAVQSQSYGPEARGGMCRAETILSREKIWYSKLTRPDFLLALTQQALDRYAPDLAPNGVVLADAGLTVPACLDRERVIAVPILATARDKVGKLMTANIVAVGAIDRALGLFDQESLTEGVRRHIPAGTEELNWKALEAGAGLITDSVAARFRQDLGGEAQNG